MTKLFGQVSDKLVLFDVNRAGATGNQQSDHMSGNSQVSDGVCRAKAGGEPRNLGWVRGDGKDVIDDDGQDDEVAIVEALGVNARVVLGTQETKFGEAVVQVAVPQQRGLFETIHIEQ